MIWEGIRRRRYQVALLAAVLLGLALRLYQAAAKDLWLDEAFGIWLGAQPVAAVLHWIVRIGQHPPLSYLLALPAPACCCMGK